MSAARVVPVEGRLDGGQFAAIVRLLLGQGLRTGVDPSSGVRGNPLRQIVVGIGFFGLLFSGNAWRCADLASYLILLFAATLVLVLIAIAPETQEARERHVEILGSKPVSRRTMFAARGVMLAVLGTLLASAFGAAPLVAARLRFGVPWGRLAVAAAALVLGAFVAAVTALVLIVIALRWRRPEQVRRVSQTLMGFFFVGVSVASMLASSGALFDPSPAPRAKIEGGVLEWLPSTWFARLAAGGDLPYADLQRGAALVLAVVAVVMVAGGGLERILPSFLEATVPPESHTRSPLAARLLRRMARLPLLGRWWLPPRPLAVAEAIVVHSHREELSRSRDLTMRLMALAAFILTVLDVLPPTFAAALFLYVVIGAATEGVRMGRQSAFPEAGWLFLKAPLRAPELLRALETAALVRAAGLPLLFLFALAFRIHPPALAALLVVAALALVKTAVGAAVALDPGPPLSREPVTANFADLAVSLVTAWIVTAGYVVLVSIGGLLGPWVLLLVVLVDLGMIAVAWTSGLVATWRLERVLGAR